MDKALIFDIQGFSVHDGPGSRTLIFFAGCPLRCTWCSNPEGLTLKRKLMFVEKKCKRSKYECVRCMEACPKGAIALSCDSCGCLTLNRSICETCDSFECAQACYAEALKVSGYWMNVEEVCDTIARDRKYWSEGGVTFSGGECFMQHDFMRQVAKWCKEQRIHTAVETTAYAQRDVFLDVMQFIDFAFIDLKCMDPSVHKQKTGVDNQLILDNIRALVETGWPGRLILRMPVIAGVNDSDANIEAMADFMDSLGLFEVNILPFHRLGDSKYTQMGRSYEYSEEKPTPPEKLEHIQGLFLDRGIACYVAEEVLY